MGFTQIAVFRTFKGSLKELPQDVKEIVVEIKSTDEIKKFDPTHIIISNPSSLHLETLRKALKLCDNIFVEKPVAVDYDRKDIDGISPLVANKQVLVGYNLRFHSVYKTLKKIIKERFLGNCLSAQFTTGHYLPFWHPYEDYSKAYSAQKMLGGGALKVLSHEIDLMGYLFGRVESIFSRMEKVSDLYIDAEDHVDILASGFACKRISIHINFLFPDPTRRGYILFEQGIVEFDYFNCTVIQTRYDNLEKTDLITEKEDLNVQYELQMQEFMEGSMGTGCSFEQGIEVDRIIALCERSAKLEKLIYV